MLDQVSKYIHIDSFVPTTGSHKDERFQADDSPICLVMDQSGIYITSEGTFQGCTAGEPVWGREQLDHRLVPVIREHLRSFV